MENSKLRLLRSHLLEEERHFDKNKKYLKNNNFVNIYENLPPMPLAILGKCPVCPCGIVGPCSTFTNSKLKSKSRHDI